MGSSGKKRINDVKGEEKEKKTAADKEINRESRGKEESQVFSSKRF